MLNKLPYIVFLVGLSVPAQAESVPFKGATYEVVVAAPAQVRVFWDKNHRTAASVHKQLVNRGETPTMILNGGIFEPGGIPSGLLIQDGKVSRPVNRKDGEGNFYLKPNGVFYIAEGKAAVMATEDYPPKGRAVQQAVQSGPLLLREGKVHPVFRPQSTSRLHRNGVGVNAKGEVVFAITDIDATTKPNLYEFATFFRSLGCRNALFLDGDLSEMRRGKTMKEPGNHLGSFILVVEKADD